MLGRRILLVLLSLVFVFFNLTDDAVAKSQKAKHKGITAMTIKQLALVPLNRRAEYVGLMREAYKDIEEIQIKFRNEALEKSARIEEGYKNLFEIAFGSTAYAQDFQQKCPNKCIYAFHLNTYAKIGGVCQDFPLGCERPPTCQMGNSKTNGFQCESSLSGLQGAKGCVSQSVRVTRTCYQQMEGLSASYKKEIDASVNAVAEYFGLNVEAGGVRKVVTKADLAPKDAESAKQVADLINRLVEFAYDDRAYAQLIGVIDMYQRAGVSYPAGVGTGKGSMIGQIQANFDGVPGTVEKIFSEYVGMCGQTLSPEVVQKIENKITPNSHLGDTTYTEEFNTLPQSQQGIWKRRINDYLIAKEAKQTYKNDNVLQKEECGYVRSRYQRLVSRTGQIASTMPTLADGAPGGGSNGPIPILPPLPEDINSAPVSLGCPSAVDRDNDNLFLVGARCTVCAAEKAVHNAKAAVPYADGKNDPGSLAKVNGDYRVSRKWVSLVSTMAVACGNGRTMNTSVDAIDVMWFLESFGHCDSDIYDWHNSEDAFLGDGQDQQDAKLVEQWQKNNYWITRAEDKSKGSQKLTPIPDRTVEGDVSSKNLKKGKNKKVGDFQRIYGLSYEQATAIFCNPENFDGKVDKKGKFLTKIKSINKTGISAVGASGSRSDARGRMKAALDRNKKIAGGPIDKNSSVFTCMTKAQDLASKLYSDNSNSCMMEQDSKVGLANIMATAADTSDSKPFAGNFIWTGAQCFVGDAVQAQKSRSGQVLKTAVGFQDPGEVIPSRTAGTFDSASRRRFDRVYRSFQLDEKTGAVTEVGSLENSPTGTYKASVVGSCSASVGFRQKSSDKKKTRK